MYFHEFPIENGDIPASHVSVPESTCQHPENFRLACAALHLLGGLLGYLASDLMGFDERTCRTVAIVSWLPWEVGVRLSPWEFRVCWMMMMMMMMMMMLWMDL